MRPEERLDIVGSNRSGRLWTPDLHEKMGVHVLFPNLLGLTQVSLVVGFCFSRVVATARLNRATWTALAHDQLHFQPVKAAGIAWT